MLAPFVLDLLIACTLLLLAGWANQFLVRGKPVGDVAHPGIGALQPDQLRQSMVKRDVFFICSPCAANGEWLFTLEDPEQN